MTCPICNGDTKVINSRHRDEGNIERRRKCKVCKYCFNAYETDEDIYFKLNKKGEK